MLAILTHLLRAALWILAIAMVYEQTNQLKSIMCGSSTQVCAQHTPLGQYLLVIDSVNL